MFRSLSKLKRKRGSVSHPDGYSIGYELIGTNPNVPCVVLLNGSLFNYRQWNRVIQFGLSHYGGKKIRILRYDYGGTGRSPRNPVVWDVFALADELRFLLDSLKIDQVHLYGISKGTIVGQVFTGLYPERVKTLAGYGWCHFEYSRMDQVLEFFSERLEHFSFLKEYPSRPLTRPEFRKMWKSVMNVVIFHRKSGVSGVGKTLLALLLKRRIYKLLSPTPARVMYDWFAYTVKMMEKAGKVFAPYYQKIEHIPILVQHARRDGTLPFGMAKELKEKLPNVVLSPYGLGYSHVSVTIHPGQARTVMKEYWAFIEPYL